jgi:hypothetical protein
MKKIKVIFKKYYSSQWGEPIIYLYKGYGITIWKWCGIFIPLINICFGHHRRIGYDIFHNGVGLRIFFPPIIIIDICLEGKIGWWYKKGKLRIMIGKKEWKY